MKNFVEYINNNISKFDEEEIKRLLIELFYENETPETRQLIENDKQSVDKLIEKIRKIGKIDWIQLLRTIQSILSFLKSFWKRTKNNSICIIITESWAD